MTLNSVPTNPVPTNPILTNSLATATGAPPTASTIVAPTVGSGPPAPGPRPRRPGPSRSRGVYLLLALMTALSAVVLTVTVGRSYRELTSTTEFFHRHAYTPSYDPLSNVVLGLPPNTVDLRTSQPSARIRAIAVGADAVRLLVGGREERVVPLPAGPAGLLDIVDRIADPSWIEQKGAGRVHLHAALVVSPGAELTITAPVREMVLTVRHGVLLGVDAGRLTLDGIIVRPSTVSDDVAALAVDERRPFVVATNSATLTITRSHLSHLGRDWNSSYGVSWSKGSTGSITHSEVDHSFIGTYTDHARDVTIADNWFHDNTLYGVDPHSYSTGIVVRNNLSEHNGRHGIIFSDYVTGGVVEGNITRNNRLNGIMMDASSTDNRIVGNTSTGNRGDGIVLASSPRNVITGNTVTGNRVGVHVRGGDADVEVGSNTIRDNQRAAQGIGLDGNTLADNGDQWRPRVVGLVWLGALGVLLVLVLLTAGARRRRDRTIARATPAHGT